MKKITILYMLTAFSIGSIAAQEKKPMVRMARIVVDAAQLEAYKTALKEEVQTAVKVEPGVLSLYAVYEKEHPTHVTVMEVYADELAYKSHLQTPHFKKYKSTTMGMVKSLQLVEAEAIGLAAKPGAKL
jgi:4-carboxymuconolactone decarboxylase